MGGAAGAGVAVPPAGLTPMSEADAAVDEPEYDDEPGPV